MQQSTRRAVLKAGGAAGLASLAGCLGGPSGGSRGLTLQTLDVEGSPGDALPVAPSGTVVLLDFFATWCAPCKPQMKSLRSLHGQYPDVHLLSITNENDDPAIREFWRTYEGSWPVAKDPELRATEEFSVGGIPTLIVLDPEGGEVWRHLGLAARDDIEDALLDAGA
ncbi:MAG: thioredoxin-like domain-containing protein [Halobacteriales archaeon]|nr:thioredoxin-like domain-containing protein [Halobacteriales archaeon]